MRKLWFFLIIFTCLSFSLEEIEESHKLLNKHPECGAILTIKGIKKEEFYCVKKTTITENDNNYYENYSSSNNDNNDNKDTHNYSDELQNKLDMIELERKMAIEKIENKIKSIQQSEYKCNTKSKCSEMDTCDEAYFYLEKCGVKRLDRDNDGIPCEKLCN